MKTLEQYVEAAASAHGHICAGQILGVRLAMYGMRLLEIEEPAGKDRKRLLTFVEIDRCATDAIAVVTGCRLGKRTLKFHDFGKVAATFCDLAAGRTVRVAANENLREQARELYPDLEDRNEQQMRAYRDMKDEEMFTHRWVKVHVPREDLPGFRAPRVVCELCGEGISFKREVVRDGRTLCRACDGETYYTVV